MTDETNREKEYPQPGPSSGAGLRGFRALYGPKIALAVVAGYLVLLAIGVVAEVFKIQSILDWWIWRPPGKP